MTTIQYNLLTVYYNDKIAYNKLINVCQTNEAYCFVCYKASNTLIGIISDLQLSITIFEQSKPLNAYIIDLLDFNPDLKLDPNIYYINYQYYRPS